MTLYAIVLYIHVLATLLLFAALSFEVLMLHRLRQAAGIAEARLWMDPVPGLRPMAIGSLIVLFFSGGYLADRMHVWTSAWPKVAVAAIILFAALGAASGRRLRAIRLIGRKEKATQTELAGKLQEGFLKISLGTRIGLVLGAILLMTAKPPLLQSLIVLGTSMVMGLAAISLLLRQQTALPTTNTARGD